jgi:hypothetical protein
MQKIQSNPKNPRALVAINAGRAHGGANVAEKQRSPLAPDVQGYSAKLLTGVRPNSAIPADNLRIQRSNSRPWEPPWHRWQPPHP